MLEDQVAYLLQRYLGNYVRGLNKEALKISVWQGDVELTNMQLKPEALNALKLPVKVKAGFLGSVKLKVPWSRLGQDPVLVYLDRIFLLAEPATHVEGSNEDAIQEAKKSRIREMEMKLLESRQLLKTEMNKSWLGSLINTVIGNLKLSISNVHIRYEDVESNPGHPFGAGITLDKLSAFTVDDNGTETFVTGGALERIQKSMELERLAVYLDSDISPWSIDKAWEDLLPSEWGQIFKFGTKDGKPATGVMKHSYVLQPVSGNAIYSKERPTVSASSGQPMQKSTVNLDDVTLCLSKSGYQDLLKLADNFAAFNQRLRFAHYRPLTSLKTDPRSWWKYAYKAVSDQVKKASGKLSWDHVLRYARLRKKYIYLYASLLKSDLDRMIVDDNEEIDELDRELDIEVILQWRMLAHKFVEQSLGSDIYRNKQKEKKSWWSFGWTSQPVKDENVPGTLTEEDWERLNNIIGYKEGEDDQLLIHDNGDVLRFSLEVHMKHNASKLIDSVECLADLSCDNLDCYIKLYKEAKNFDIKLGSYRLLSPNGLIAESESINDSLVGVFCYKPFDADVDWSFVAKASPCYVTYLKDSIDRIVNFFQGNAAVSQTLALETASAVQMTIDEVKRTAAREVNRALKDHARFLLDLDIAAPKITIPTDFCPDSIHPTKLLLDLGKLVIRTKDDAEYTSPEEMGVYIQFDLALSDVSAFLVDGDYHWSQASPNRTDGSSKSSVISFLPVIDKCSVFLKLQQIRSKVAPFPSTRLALRLPSMGLHFSPARYHRLMQVAKIFRGEEADNADLVCPWDQADFEGWLYHLTWKGVGGREAVWQRRYFCMVGPFLYLLENPGSRYYKYRFSLRGKQLYQVPAGTIGNLENVLAVCDPGRSNIKVVEDANALILRCDSEDARRIWQSYLQGAIYRASGSSPIIGLTSSDSEDSETDNRELMDFPKAESLFVTGVLDELKIQFSYSCQHDQNFMKLLLAEEKRLIEFRAIGGQVELSIRSNDMFIGTVLKALEVEDLVCCEGMSQVCFLARSFIRNANMPSLLSDIEIPIHPSGDSNQFEGDDEFYEAPENLNDSVDIPMLPDPHSGSPAFRAPSFTRVPGLLPSDVTHTEDGWVEVIDTQDSFVKAQIVIFDQNSPLYTSIDKQVSVTLSTLSFFCRRPTILAIMEFADSMNAKEDGCEFFSDASSSAVASNDLSKENIHDGQSNAVEETVVRSLLGKGKSRVVFYLKLNMVRAEILLMKENGTKLATLSQDNFLTEIKVFPSSFSIKASLGNLRISDDSLHSNHMYFWACDMRNPGGSSFVELVFSSFSADDEDYKGYDYSLIGQLSEVRIVYLNRFVQEVISYFMGLAPSNPKDVVRIKDQVTNTEKLFTSSEIEGSPALKLDLSLKKPIILMPRRTDSLDCLKLDVVQITVQNNFRWIGGSKNEVKAVHMDVLEVLVEDINLNIGSGSEFGESIIQDVKGVSIIICRSLRDLLRQSPSTEVSIKIEELKAALSNKEYEIISECAQANFSETPNIVQPLKVEPVSPSVDVSEQVISQVLDSTKSGTQYKETWIVIKVSVEIELVELSLHYGVTRDASLATVQVSGVWLLYKSNAQGEGFLSATLKEFTVVDDRDGTEKELRLAIGKPDMIDYTPSQSGPDKMDDNVVTANLSEHAKKFVLTMLIVDAKFSNYSTSISLCIQRPQLLVALDFLLAIAEFFVPTIHGVLSHEENANSSHFVDALILDQSTFCQPSAEFSISPQRPMVADDEKYDIFIYDGRGGILYLKDRQGLNVGSPSTEALIYVGTGKKLQFRNVTIKNGLFLDSCVLLGSNSSYSASEMDNVILEEENTTFNHSSEDTVSEAVAQNVGASRPTELIFELQAIGPELAFCNTTRTSSSLILSNKLLHAQLDAFCRVVLKGDTVEITANVLGLTMESNGIKILEPFDTSVKVSSASGKMNIQLAVSDIFINFSFSILRLFLAIEEDILSFLRMTTEKTTVLCSEFDRVGIIKNPVDDNVYAFWRPRAPSGFGVLGDYLTPIDKPPTKAVIAVNTSLVRVRRPKSFSLVWPPSASDGLLYTHGKHNDKVAADNTGADGDGFCSIWFPEAPKGYVALGCVASPGRTQPPVSSVFCILASLVSPCGLRDCINISSSSRSSSLAFWRVDNAIGTFLPADPDNLSLTQRAYELRHIYFGFPEISPEKLNSSKIPGGPSGGQHNVQTERSPIVNSRRFETVASFRLIWWNQGSGSRKKLSIWRPVIPEGMVYFGDIAVQGHEPPNTCIVLHDSEDSKLYRAPSNFQLVGRIKKHGIKDEISFWMPQAPPGFVALGCIACKGMPKLSDFSSLRCIRSDMVTADQFLEESMWDTSDFKFTKEPFSIWTVDNDLGTFIIRKGLKKPPRRFALKLAESDIPSGSDNSVIIAEIRTFSAALFDDYGGLMVPLCNVSLSDIGFGLHGRPDCLNSHVNFSLAVRSYNDKYESWEPLIEPVDGSLRYQYNPNTRRAASQIRLTSTSSLNLNVSVCNANMIFQAYASWNNLGNIQEPYGEAIPSTAVGNSVIDVHHKKDYYIIPQNKLGQDIFIRASEIRGLSSIIKMPSGDSKTLKVPVSKNMLNSHLKGSTLEKLKTMVTIVIADAELLKVDSVSSHQYTVAVRIYPDTGHANVSFLDQRARTSGKLSEDSKSSADMEVVKWNEIFFFKVDSLDCCMVEFIVTDVGKGNPVCYFQAPMKELFRSQDYSNIYESLNELHWLELSSAESVLNVESRKIGRIRCALLLSPRSENDSTEKPFSGNKNSSFIQISPTKEGPWFNVRLNYSTPASCWRLGNEVVASEMSIIDGNRYVNIRSLVSVRNRTDFSLDLCLQLRASNDNTSPMAGEEKEGNYDGNELATDEFFETEKYNPSVGWVRYCDDEEGSRVELPSRWEWVDEWHIDNTSVNNADGWVYAPDFASLKWPESYPPKYVNYARQRRWIRKRKQVARDFRSQVYLGTLKPGEIIPLPLSCLTQTTPYVLQFRPSNRYSWSCAMSKPTRSQDVESSKEVSEVFVSALRESEELLYCSEMSGSSSSSSLGLWFCLSIQATEIAKNISLDPIQDWTIVVKSPISIANYLPVVAEISVLEMQASGHFLSCFRGIFSPGETVRVYNADIRRPLYFSLLPQTGWLPLQEAILFSHPSIAPSKTLSLRSSISGRVVQIVIEQSYTSERPLQARIIKVYSPCWLAISRCPPLSFRLIDMGVRKSKKIPVSFTSKRTKEFTFEEITEEEIYEGATIASALNFKSLGLSASISQAGGEHFGPVKDLSPLGDMDGSLDLFAYNADGNCMRLFVSSKPCPYQSIPTKVISVCPFMTFTNRFGQTIYLKFSSEDEPKALRISDARVSFVHHETEKLNEIQVRLEDTDWSFPIQILKEDSITLVVRKNDGARRYLRTEIRGYEEGSRFIVVFRVGSVNGPIRIENRTKNRMIRIRQTGFGDDAWISLHALSTTIFSWEDPYGQKFIDTEIHGPSCNVVCKFDLDKYGLSSVEDDLGLFIHVVNIGDIKVIRFVNETTPFSISNGRHDSLTQWGNWGNTNRQANMSEDGSPLELMVELGVVGISVVDHRPRELAYMYMERILISYSTGYDGGTTSRFKLMVGYMQLDNQLPLTIMPVLLAPEGTPDVNHPVFKMTVTVRNENLDGIQIYPYVYIRVIDEVWRLNIHEPIIWALVDFFNNLQLDRIPQNSSVTQVDPELRIDLIDISRVRLKVSLETAPAERPHGLLGVWSPILSAVGNAFKFQVHLRRVMQRDRFLRKSAIMSAIGNRIWRDLIHNPLHLIFSVDVLGMTSSTLASLSRGFAELSTDGQFLQLRSKQVWSRRITGVGDGIMQGTEALAQGVAFGVSGVVRKPVESARQNGLLGLAHGLGQAFLGFVLQPMSGVLDFFSLTVDGIGASCSRCLEIVSNKKDFQRIRNPRAIHTDHILKEYSEREAVGQMILHLAEASRNFGCTDIFKEPSKFAWSDCYEHHFMVPYQRIVLVTNRRVMLLQSLDLDRLDEKPCKIIWDVPWKEIMSLELVKAGYPRPSHLIIHLKNFRRSENFVRVIKCNTEEETEETEPQAVRICSVVRKMWKAYLADEESSMLKVPASQRHVPTSWSERGRESRRQHRAIITSTEISSSGSLSNEWKFVKHSINFSKVWSSEQEQKSRCTLCRKQSLEDGEICSIWRPVCPDGYVSIGDIARTGNHAPNVAAVYYNSDELFARPVGYDLVWRNCADDYRTAVSIWHPRAPEGFVSPGCIAIPSFSEPESDAVYCIAESLTEETFFEEQKIWSAPDSYPWGCHIYQVQSDALHFVALRQPKEESDWTPRRVLDEPRL